MKTFQLALLLVETFRPLSMMIATLAPRTDAFDTPSVAGEAIGLLRQVCMIRPDIDRPIPHKTAARILGSLIFCMMRILIVSPLPNRPKKASLNFIDEDPKNKEKKARSIVKTKIDIRRMRTFLFCC